MNDVDDDYDDGDDDDDDDDADDYDDAADNDDDDDADDDDDNADDDDDDSDENDDDDVAVHLFTEQVSRSNVTQRSPQHIIIQFCINQRRVLLSIRRCGLRSVVDYWYVFSVYTGRFWY